jgi:hypothetical protein
MGSVLPGTPALAPGPASGVNGWSIQVSFAGKVQEPGLTTSTVAKTRILDALTENLPGLTTVEVAKHPRSPIRAIETRFVHRRLRVAGR